MTPDIIEFLSKHQKVKFGKDFNQPIHEDSPTGKSSILPNSLTHLQFGKYFNQPVDNLPSGLTQLIFGKYSDFNQPVDNLPNSLTHLTFGDDFHQPVENLPNKSKYFDEYQQKYVETTGLIELRLGNHFNYPINNLPNSLKILKFGDNLIIQLIIFLLL